MQRGPQIGVPALDDYIYDVQLTLASLLIPARHVMRTTAELLQAQNDEQTILLDADIIQEIRHDINMGHALINSVWQERGHKC